MHECLYSMRVSSFICPHIWCLNWCHHFMFLPSTQHIHSYLCTHFLIFDIFTWMPGTHISETHCDTRSFLFHCVWGGETRCLLMPFESFQADRIELVEQERRVWGKRTEHITSLWGPCESLVHREHSACHINAWVSEGKWWNSGISLLLLPKPKMILQSRRLEEIHDEMRRFPGSKQRLAGKKYKRYEALGIKQSNQNELRQHFDEWIWKIDSTGMR